MAMRNETSNTLADRRWFQWYEPGVPHTITVPDQPLHDFLRTATARVPARPAIRFEGRALSYQEVGDAATRFASALVALGLHQGDRVALLLPNCPQFVIAYYGGLRAGTVVVPINPLYAEPELQHQLADAEARVLVCLSAILPKVQAIRAGLPALEQVIVTNIKEYLPAVKQAVFSLREERRGGHRPELPQDERTHWLQPLLASAAVHHPRVPVTVDDVALLQYTAGTTGIPKGVMLTHRNLVASALEAHAWCRNVSKPDGADVVLGVIPLFHIYAQTTVMNFPIVGGGTMILQPRFSVKAILRAIATERPDFFPAVPAIYDVISQAPNVSNYDLHSLKACLSGAAPLPREVQERFEALTGARLVEGYGLSEAPVTHCNPINGRRKIGSIGIPIPSTDAAIVDLEAGIQRLGPGELGELAVRGPQVMKGYWRHEAETAQVVKNGWLLTGDIARMDEDGFFTIVDRKKDLINVSGLKVSPSEVEACLAGLPMVKEVAVVGIPDTQRGEMVKAYVILNEGQSATEQEMIDACRTKLAPYKVPRVVEFRPELPKNMVGKVLRRRLIEEELSRRINSTDQAPR
ncbi:long-chain-fatty-acid--CoA ligase [Nitrolancea hollandica]|uniref:Long-chain-fatty-acid--CoA ligase n=1 Tax=Nitrolancea hollandica Lb TaxID=1129897 RepID=I4EJF8_9BACT|nr:long-chain fatty acid--CoA ligase [Nitrolancea hollandica]CCF84820.1 Long-chain-fatty-acid--CoA ligase [Nitrolancea hollandica Lb]